MNKKDWPWSGINMMKKYEDNPRFIGAKSKQNPSKPMGVLDIIRSFMGQWWTIFWAVTIYTIPNDDWFVGKSPFPLSVICIDWTCGVSRLIILPVHKHSAEMRAHEAWPNQTKANLTQKICGISHWKSCLRCGSRLLECLQCSMMFPAHKHHEKHRFF